MVGAKKITLGVVPEVMGLVVVTTSGCMRWQAKGSAPAPASQAQVR